jgi:hypothetical protein
MITWNVWFGGESWDNPRLRYETILEICQNLDADVICFQEVTRTFIDVSVSVFFIFIDAFDFLARNEKKCWLVARSIRAKCYQSGKIVSKKNFHKF